LPSGYDVAGIAVFWNDRQVVALQFKNTTTNGTIRQYGSTALATKTQQFFNLYGSYKPIGLSS